MGVGYFILYSIEILLKIYTTYKKYLSLEIIKMKNTHHLFVLSTLITFVIASFLSAQTEPEKSELNISSLPDGVSVYQLDNGMDVLLIENTGLPMTGVNVVVKTGSAFETFSTSGMSHMLEHLLFNGTESQTQKELYDAVDLIGGYNNANTGTYYTNYMINHDIKIITKRDEQFLDEKINIKKNHYQLVMLIDF